MRIVRPTINHQAVYGKDSKTLASLCHHLIEHYDQEQLWTISMNWDRMVTSCTMIYQGNICETGPVKPAEVLRPVVRDNGYYFIITHSHPGLNPRPSNADIQLTKRIQQAAQVLDLKFQDHIIVTRHDYYSMLAARDMTPP